MMGKFSALQIRFLIRAIMLLISSSQSVIGQSEGVTREEALGLREEVKSMFYHAYNNYMEHAFPLDELRPLSCSGEDTLGGYSLTLIDAMDTLALLGDVKEFSRAVRWVSCNVNFDKNQTVSVFETNIRVLGGLLSAHLIASDPRTGMAVDGYYGKLLDLAIDLGRRLLPAFYTPTGIPFGSVNLQTGVLPEETTVTSTAGGGTLALEFGLLSRLTSDPVFEDMALNSLRGLWSRRSPLGLVGAHIDVYSGDWTHRDAGIGTSIDSFYEYLLKAHLLLGGDETLHMFREAYDATQRHLHQPPWYLEVNMDDGMLVWPLFNSLQAFWPGLQVLAGDVEAAAQTHAAFYGVWRRFGFTPEGFNLVNQDVQAGQKSYPLRPELAESTYWLYRATRDPMYLHVGRDIVASIQYGATCPCGYCHVSDVQTHEKEDHMESFFLSETVKYLWLLFDSALGGDNLVENGPYPYVFSTEGHLFPIRPDLSLERFAESASESESEDQPELAEQFPQGRLNQALAELNGSPSSQSQNKEAGSGAGLAERSDERAGKERVMIATEGDTSERPVAGSLPSGAERVPDCPSRETAGNKESELASLLLGESSDESRQDEPVLVAQEEMETVDRSSLTDRTNSLEPTESMAPNEERSGSPVSAADVAEVAFDLESTEPHSAASKPPSVEAAGSDVIPEATSDVGAPPADVSASSDGPGTPPGAGKRNLGDGSEAATCPSPDAATHFSDIAETPDIGPEAPAPFGDVSGNVTDPLGGEEATWDVWTDEGAQPLVGRCPALSFWRQTGVHNMAPFPPSADTVINHGHIQARHKQRQMHQMKMATFFQQAASARGQSSHLPLGQKFMVTVNHQGQMLFQQVAAPPNAQAAPPPKPSSVRSSTATTPPEILSAEPPTCKPDSAPG